MKARIHKNIDADNVQKAVSVKLLSYNCIDTFTFDECGPDRNDSKLNVYMSKNDFEWLKAQGGLYIYSTNINFSDVENINMILKIHRGELVNNAPAKFRIWNPDIRRMFYTGISSDGTPISESSMFGSGCFYMQFTKYKDSDDKEIYEGDLLRFKDRICQVCWNDDIDNYEAIFLYNTSTRKYGNLRTDADRWNKNAKVIGNMYENTRIMLGHYSD